VESTLGPRGTAATTWPILPVAVDCEDEEVGGMKCGWQGTPKYSEKTCPDAILSTTNPTCRTRARTRAAAVGNRRLTASAMARPLYLSKWTQTRHQNYARLYRNHVKFGLKLFVYNIRDSIPFELTQNNNNCTAIVDNTWVCVYIYLYVKKTPWF
jgi:hypothetical protein